MFGNLAALSTITSPFTPSFQLQLGAPIALQCDPLSRILYTYSIREFQSLKTHPSPGFISFGQA